MLGPVAGPQHAQDFLPVSWHSMKCCLPQQIGNLEAGESRYFCIALQKPPVLPVCVRIATRNLGKEKILLLIKHPEPRFPFGDDSGSSVWVEEKGSRKSFLIEV